MSELDQKDWKQVSESKMNIDQDRARVGCLIGSESILIPVSKKPSTPSDASPVGSLSDSQESERCRCAYLLNVWMDNS